MKIPDIIEKFADYRKKHPTTWGSLHLVLEDGNVKDKDVIFCREWAERHSDNAGFELANILLKMSKTQRLCLGSRVDKWLEVVK